MKINKIASSLLTTSIIVAPQFLNVVTASADSIQQPQISVTTNADNSKTLSIPNINGKNFKITLSQDDAVTASQSATKVTDNRALLKVSDNKNFETLFNAFTNTLIESVDSQNLDKSVRDKVKTKLSEIESTTTDGIKNAKNSENAEKIFSTGVKAAFFVIYEQIDNNSTVAKVVTGTTDDFMNEVIKNVSNQSQSLTKKDTSSQSSSEVTNSQSMNSKQKGESLNQATEQSNASSVEQVNKESVSKTDQSIVQSSNNSSQSSENKGQTTNSSSQSKQVQSLSNNTQTQSQSSKAQPNNNGQNSSSNSSSASTSAKANASSSSSSTASTSSSSSEKKDGNMLSNLPQTGESKKSTITLIALGVVAITSATLLLMNNKDGKKSK